MEEKPTAFPFAFSAANVRREAALFVLGWMPALSVLPSFCRAENRKEKSLELCNNIESTFVLKKEFNGCIGFRNMTSIWKVKKMQWQVSVSSQEIASHVSDRDSRKLETSSLTFVSSYDKELRAFRGYFGLLWGKKKSLFFHQFYFLLAY